MGTSLDIAINNVLWLNFNAMNFNYKTRASTERRRVANRLVFIRNLINFRSFDIYFANELQIVGCLFVIFCGRAYANCQKIIVLLVSLWNFNIVNLNNYTEKRIVFSHWIQINQILQILIIKCQSLIQIFFQLNLRKIFVYSFELQICTGIFKWIKILSLVLRLKQLQLNLTYEKHHCVIIFTLVRRQLQLTVLNLCYSH